jgi:hypothetical protein
MMIFIGRDISLDVLSVVALLSRGRLAGLRAAIGEILVSRKKRVGTRGNACPVQNDKLPALSGSLPFVLGVTWPDDSSGMNGQG